MSQLVTIPISTFEIAIEYEIPSVRLWVDRTQVIEAMFEAFRPWALNFDDIDVIDQGKNSDKGLRFRLPLKRASFFLGAAYCRFSQDDANWSMMPDAVAILQAGVSMLLEVAKVRKSNQRTTLALHLQPKSGRFVDILRPFVPSQLAGLESAPVQAIASVVKWGNRRIYLDGSGSLANAVFVKIDRDFGPEATYEQIAEQIYADERTIFNILDVEEDLS